MNNDQSNYFLASSSDLNENKQIFILSNTLSKNYIQDLKNACCKNGFHIQEKFDLTNTNIVVSNLQNLEQTFKILKLNSNQEKHTIYVVNLKWITDSNKKGSLVDHLNTDYFIGCTNPNIKPNDLSPNTLRTKSILDNFELFEYECQRPTLLKHQNEELTSALEILEEYAEFKGTEQDLLRALAFRRGICVLKCVPIKITNIRQLKNLKHIGEHTLTVIEDILSFGYSKEVDSITSQDYYHVMKMFYPIFGCGPAVANRLYTLGYKTLQNLRENRDNLSKRVQSDFERLKYGLAYYDDLVNKRISKDECDFIFDKIKSIILNEVSSECLIELVGGFRRGKKDGHDVDILITHPKLGEEKFLITKIAELLESKGFVIYGKHDTESNHDWTKITSKNRIDHFERYFSILKFPIFQLENSNRRRDVDNDDHDSNENSNKNSKKFKQDLSESKRDEQILFNQIIECLDATKFKRNWIARRVDIITCPINEFPFAILGWIGSKHFNRSIRLYSDKELNYKLSSHGLFDNKRSILMTAKTERDIFDLLNLKYLEPFERNC